MDSLYREKKRKGRKAKTKINEPTTSRILAPCRCSNLKITDRPQITAEVTPAINRNFTDIALEI
jgi:hypothetical protein